MMNKIFLTPIALLSLGFTLIRGAEPKKDMMPESIYDIEILNLDETENIDFKSYQGKKILIINVASECGYTYQYEGMQELAEKYAESLVVLGVPCNQFGHQEPGSNEEIKDFCTSNYGVGFPMTTKVDVLGENQHPLYTWLTSKEFNGVDDYTVKWNFNKFLIDENGKFMKYFGSRVKPMDDELIEAIES